MLGARLSRRLSARIRPFRGDASSDAEHVQFSRAVSTVLSLRHATALCKEKRCAVLCVTTDNDDGQAGSGAAVCGGHRHDKGKMHDSVIAALLLVNTECTFCLTKEWCFPKVDERCISIG